MVLSANGVGRPGAGVRGEGGRAGVRAGGGPAVGRSSRTITPARGLPVAASVTRPCSVVGRRGTSRLAVLPLSRVAGAYPGAPACSAVPGGTRPRSKAPSVPLVVVAPAACTWAPATGWPVKASSTWPVRARGAGVAVGGTAVAVGGTAVAVGGTAVAVGGTAVAGGAAGAVVGGGAPRTGVRVGPAGSVDAGPAAGPIASQPAMRRARIRPARLSGQRGAHGAGDQVTKKSLLQGKRDVPATKTRLAAYLKPRYGPCQEKVCCAAASGALRPGGRQIGPGHDGVAAAGFGLVEGTVGMVDQLGVAGRVLRVAGDALADRGHRQAQAIRVGHRQCGQGRPDAPGHAESLEAGRPGQHDGELFAPPAPDRVRHLDVLPDRHDDRAEGDVARHMPI